MLQRRARARTKAVKVKNEILKLPNEEVGILKVEVRNSSCMQYLVSLVHLWSVINYLRGYLAQSSGVFKCCQCFFFTCAFFFLLCCCFRTSAAVSGRDLAAVKGALWDCEGTIYGGIHQVRLRTLDLSFLATRNLGKLLPPLVLKWQRERTMLLVSVVAGA